MESKLPPRTGARVELAAVFSDLVRMETELWDRVDRRLRRDHDLPLSWFEPMHVMAASSEAGQGPCPTSTRSSTCLGACG